MAFTASYVNLANLATDSTFINRVTLAIANYAKYIIGEDPATQFHKSRDEWAKAAVQNPQGYTSQLRFFIAMDPLFSGQSTTPIDANSITDAQMDTVVQTAINNTILKF